MNIAKYRRARRLRAISTQRLPFVLGALMALLVAGCQGIVLQPGDTDDVSEKTWIPFTGYTIAPSTDVTVEVRSGSTWKVLRSIRSTTSPSYTEGNTGYRFNTSISRSELSRYASGNQTVVRIMAGSNALKPRRGMESGPSSSLVDLWEHLESNGTTISLRVK